MEMSLDQETIREIAVLSTKLDTVVELLTKSTAGLEAVERRVDSLEGDRRWVKGVGFAVVTAAGAIGYGFSLHIDGIVGEHLRSISYVDEVCREVRHLNPDPDDVPKLCTMHVNGTWKVK